MQSNRTGQIAVIFSSLRTAEDEAGYAQAAAEMESLASTQPGYRGMISARGADGFGITVSYWADEASAGAWRDHPAHTMIRNQGRAIWYSSYTLDVAEVGRSYDWTRDV